MVGSGALRWEPGEQICWPVDLEGADVGQLEDAWTEANKEHNGNWPAGGQLHLDGFTYRRLGGQYPATVKQRLKWIQSQYRPSDTGWQGFATQPYEQLAAVYRQAGLDTQARKAAIARRADPRMYGNLSSSRTAGNLLLDKTIKYGYETWRAAIGLVAVFIVFALLAFFAQQHHLMVPVGDTTGLPVVPSATKCTSNYPCFYPVGYAVDTVIPLWGMQLAGAESFQAQHVVPGHPSSPQHLGVTPPSCIPLIPLINVHQAAYWGADGHAPLGQAWVVGTWIATGLGWALATLLVAGYTGLVRRD